jgi:hypothetical protein
MALCRSTLAFAASVTLYLAGLFANLEQQRCFGDIWSIKLFPGDPTVFLCTVYNWFLLLKIVGLLCQIFLVVVVMSSFSSSSSYKSDNSIGFSRWILKCANWWLLLVGIYWPIYCTLPDRSLLLWFFFIVRGGWFSVTIGLQLLHTAKNWN